MTAERRLPDIEASAALVLVDLQNDFCSADGAFAAAGFRLADVDRLVGRVNELVRAARRCEVPVVWVRMVYRTDADIGQIRDCSPVDLGNALKDGTWGADLLVDLESEPGDVYIDKSRFSAFFDTGLEEWLRGRGVTRLVVGGVRTDVCVETTVRDAFMRDFEVLVEEGACASYVPRFHEHSLQVLAPMFAEVSSRGTDVLKRASTSIG